jgi:hypothetical protein
MQVMNQRSSGPNPIRSRSMRRINRVIARRRSKYGNIVKTSGIARQIATGMSSLPKNSFES